jgi:hypothetical protein
VLHTIFHSMKERIMSLFLLKSQPRRPRTGKNRHPGVLIGCTIQKVTDHGHQLEKIHLARQLHFLYSVTNWQHSLFTENISGPSMPCSVLGSTNPEDRTRHWRHFQNLASTYWTYQNRFLMFAQVDEFHNFTLMEWLAPLDLQMPWLQQGALRQPPRKWAYPEMCSSNQADGSGRSHHPNVLCKILVGHSNPQHHIKISLRVSLLARF